MKYHTSIIILAPTSVIRQENKSIKDADTVIVYPNNPKESTNRIK